MLFGSPSPFHFIVGKCYHSGWLPCAVAGNLLRPVVIPQGHFIVVVWLLLVSFFFFLLTSLQTYCTSWWKVTSLIQLVQSDTSCRVVKGCMVLKKVHRWISKDWLFFSYKITDDSENVVLPPSRFSRNDQKNGKTIIFFFTDLPVDIPDRKVEFHYSTR